ncbi:hypothetical protein [Thermicanus aegyptius]|uniref:hypothetical protein n=1 Tax=Thermicanus aegyptius TaxID=94009 RepID=UPI000412856F|nr:hypothetical protein [Thermicanus aegyptius]
MAVVPVPGHAEAIKIAEEIERLEAVLKAKKEQLKLFVKQVSPIEAGDKVWDFYPSVSWEFTPEKLKEMAKDIAIEGENPWEYLTIPASSLKKLGWGEDVLSHYGKKKETLRFESRSRKQRG